ncbi:hypothetical protein [Streptomyces sp. NPDC001435]
MGASVIRGDPSDAVLVEASAVDEGREMCGQDGEFTAGQIGEGG